MIEEKLTQLAEVQKGLERIKAERKAIYDALISPEIQEAIRRAEDVSDLHGLDEMAKLATQENELTNDIKTAVLTHGQSVKAAGLQAVYTKGASRWDSKRLEAYATTHPELLEMKTVGEPSVSIRAAK